MKMELEGCLREYKEGLRQNNQKYDLDSFALIIFLVTVTHVAGKQNLSVKELNG